MNAIEVAVSKSEGAKFRGDIAVVFVYQTKSKKIVLPEIGKTYLKTVSKLGDFEAKSGQLLLVYSQEHRELKKYGASRICFVGGGEKASKENLIHLAEKYRDLGGKTAQKAKDVKAESIAVFADTIDEVEKEISAQMLTEGIMLGSYRFDKYKKPDPENVEKALMQLIFYGQDRFAQIKKAS